MPKIKLKTKDKQGVERVRGSVELTNQTDISADLFFYGDIVSESWQSEYYEDDMCPKDVEKLLEDIGDVETLNIYINSGGGSVFGGIGIYNILKRCKAEKVVHIDGIAASIASVIAMCGDRIIVPQNATFMIHKPSNGYFFTSKNADELRKDADTLDTCQKNILNTYMQKVKSGVEESTINEMINAETWLTGSEMEEYFNVEVEESNQAAAATSDYFEKYNHTPKSLVATSQKPSKKTENTAMDMDVLADKIANKIATKLENDTSDQKIINELLSDLDSFGAKE